MFSVIVDADGHERGPTSHHVIRTEIQRDVTLRSLKMAAKLGDCRKLAKDNLQESGNDSRMTVTTNITGRGTQAPTFDESLCSPVWESSLHQPSKLLYRCLATTDLLVGLVTQPLYATYWMSLVHKHWSLCRYARDAVYISSYALCGVSLLTSTAISVDRLFAILLGLRYKEIVTLRRTYIILAIVWVVCLVAGLFSHLNYRIALSSSLIITPFCVVISIAAYTKIFRALGHHQAQIQDHVQQQPSHPNALNMVRYREAVYNALWVQLALVVCYAPQFVGKIVRFASRKRFSSFFIIHEMAIILMFFNSTLNPFLYCWKISEVRRGVKQTIRRAICFAEE
ncbi:melanocortin receptor 5-like isoform X3 [Pocillopora verrucosa]|uniref:melanocortin receptor 5-like isoform X3 n=1 Tax=Pocillopora verrucosa TaxID=203993 RepID=UPI002797852F|nr:melanocortin receptor 5-like isoform X3 [Pocillopora verrucosa]